MPYSSYEPGELSQWLCYDDSTINSVGVVDVNVCYKRLVNVSVIGETFSPLTVIMSLPVASMTVPGRPRCPWDPATPGGPGTTSPTSPYTHRQLVY